MTTEQQNNLRWAAKNNGTTVSLGSKTATAYFSEEGDAESFINDAREYVTIKKAMITIDGERFCASIILK